MATDRIEATYRVVTPMFCGGARPDVAELRLASFKGVLRFWWRALTWGRFNGDLSGVKAAEDAIFGSAHVGQSKVSIRTVEVHVPKVLKKDEILRVNGQIVGEGARYLGYGVMGAFGYGAGMLTRACLYPPFDFKLELRCSDLDDVARSGVLGALRAIDLLGGLGARSRKGYGSVVLRALVINGVASYSAPDSLRELTHEVEVLYANSGVRGASSQELAPYTALSSRARSVLVQAKSPTSPLEFLDRIGRELMRYRSWGYKGKVLGKNSEKNFKDDHDLMKQPPAQRVAHPRRIVFGLPHNYGKQADQQVGPGDKAIDRRASPMFIHIHECGSTPVAVLSFLPGRFLPEGDTAKISVGGRQVRIAPDPEIWTPVEDLMDRFLDETKRTEPFGVVMEVRP